MTNLELFFWQYRGSRAEDSTEKERGSSVGKKYSMSNRQRIYVQEEVSAKGPVVRGASGNLV